MSFPHEKIDDAVIFILNKSSLQAVESAILELADALGVRTLRGQPIHAFLQSIAQETAETECAHLADTNPALASAVKRELDILRMSADS